MKISKTQLTPAKCALDLGDGSERGLYVNQDYILRKLGRPHRGINIMYCYYPFDKEWPQRVSEACKDTNISFAWDYPYDDYFPYRGGIDGNHGIAQAVHDHSQGVFQTAGHQCRPQPRRSRRSGHPRPPAFPSRPPLEWRFFVHGRDE